MFQVLEDSRVLEDEFDTGRITGSSLEGPSLSIESAQHRSQVACEAYNGGTIQLAGSGEKRRIIKGHASDMGGVIITLDTPFPGDPVGKTYQVIQAAQSLGAGEDSHEVATSVTQTVFDLIDQLTKWHERETHSLRRGDDGHDKRAVNNVSKLLSGIPTRILAETSFRCGAHDRALMYLEASIRSGWDDMLKYGKVGPASL